MFSRGKKKGTTRFTIKPAEAVREVLLAGDFNNWDPFWHRMQETDGEWVTDPDNDSDAPNPQGTFNSVARVESPRQPGSAGPRGAGDRPAEAVLVA